MCLTTCLVCSPGSPENTIEPKLIQETEKAEAKVLCHRMVMFTHDLISKSPLGLQSRSPPLARGVVSPGADPNNLTSLESKRPEFLFSRQSSSPCTGRSPDRPVLAIIEGICCCRPTGLNGRATLQFN